MQSRIAWLVLPGLFWAAAAQAGAADMAYTTNAAALVGKVVAVDARSEEACLKRSVAGARCMPAADFLGPHGRLAAFADIYWLLGTAGLSANDAVLVVGDDPVERDFVAGMLYLCGQSSVTILTRPVSGGAGLAASRLGPGVARGMLRQPIYRGTVRENRIVLRNELSSELSGPRAVALVDGRPGAAYWGQAIRAMRGGHLPGAQSLPLAELRNEIVRGQTRLPPGAFVVYGHDPFESVAYFTLARAGAGADARVLLGGWVGWASHPDLPVDALTYPDVAVPSVTERDMPAVAPAGDPTTKHAAEAGAMAMGFLLLMAGSWYLGRKSKP